MRAATALAIFAVTLAGPRAGARQSRQGRQPLFPPESLGLLESPDREEWQQPDRIMDALNIADGSRVADLGAGSGWFTERLARRVGPNGAVYAEDIQREMIDAIEQRIRTDRLTNVHTILGAPDDPRLPADLHAVLLVDAFGQLPDPAKLLDHVAHALTPNGRLGIVDFKRDGGGPGPPFDQRVDPELVVQTAQRAGLRLVARETFLRYQFLLVFGR